LINIVKHTILILLVSISIQCNQYKISKYSSENITIDEKLSTRNFPEINLKAYQDSINSEMDEILNWSLREMDVGSPEGVLGNFITDLSLFTLNNLNKDLNIKADFCILNNGGLRTPINEGPITRRKIFEVMPFENELVVLKLNPSQLNELLQFIIEKSYQSNSRKAGVPVSGIRLRISNNKITRGFINTKEIDRSKSYLVLTTDYLANGGDHMNFFKGCKDKIPTGILLRDAIIDYIKNINTTNIKVDAALDGRIEILQ
jgi:2',3'-cyclic-nucleotide 2'-phosphodiesterase (5'-nucleotidase family)